MPLQFTHSPSAHPFAGKDWTAPSRRMPTERSRTIERAVSSIPSPAGIGSVQTSLTGQSRPSARREWIPSGPRGRRRRALVLDPDPNVLNVLGQLLGDENYDVMLSAQFLQREEIIHLDPDVIIADAAFNHGPDGNRLYGEAPRRLNGTLIPIVYSTTEPEIAARLMDLHIPTLLKPFDLDLLLALLSGGDT